MKKYTFIIVSLFLLLVTSCDFLDVVPDEISTEEDAFANPKAAERYLYSCYGFLPNPREGAASLDFFTGDEVVTAFEHETFANFPKGNFTANEPIISYWNTFFIGLRQCYILKREISKVPGIDPETVKDYTAQADFLIAYYHYLLLRCYGPIILIKEEPSVTTPASDFLGRTPYDECVSWIAAKFDEAAANLPARREEQKIGLATKTAAIAIKSRMYLFAASPLFNGNSAFYANFKNPDGTALMPLMYDANKWVVAKNTAKEAIDAATAAGYRLYQATDVQQPTNPEPTNTTLRTLRFGLVDKTSQEPIWVDTREETAYSLNRKSLPFGTSGYNGICPTLNMLDRFYTDKGLPLKEDPSFDFDGRFDVVQFPQGDPNGEGETSKMNLQREPRYYAWISFHGGYYEAIGNVSQNSQWEPYKTAYKRGVDNKKLVTFFKKDDNCGVKNRSNNYSPGGFLSKKGVHPNATMDDSNVSYEKYPWTLLGMSELYLNYAEACVETNDLGEAAIYINKIRERAGLPTLQTSWAQSRTGIAAISSQEKMREIVRQERMIELYLQGHNFWDMRRWLLAEQYFGQKPKGLNIRATTMSEFSKQTELNITRNFVSPTHYLLPIPYSEVQNNRKLVQNPGY